MQLYIFSLFRVLACTALTGLLMSSVLLVSSAHAETILSFQKVSALEGGLTESGVTLDTRDDFGESLDTVGDLDGDGIIDLVVGSQRDDDGGEDRGSVYILFMNTDGTVDRSQKISDTEGGFTGSLDNGDTFGIGATGLGDLDGDGVLDIAVGAARDDDGGNNLGAVYILFLNTDGTVKNHQKISHTVGGFSGNTSNFGGDLEMLGDLDGDGAGDLFVSARSGEFYILFLNTDGTVKQDNRITQGGSGAFGTTGALIGDLDGDGIMDICTGAQFDDDGATNAGAIWILFMNANGTVRDRQKISLLEGGFNGLLQEGDQFGQSVSPVGDLNNDGIPDLLVGAEAADSPDDLVNNSGEIWLLFMNRNGTVQSEQRIGTGTPNFIDVRVNSNLGQAVTFLGDLNGDGFDDIAAAADGDIDGAGTMTGAFYVFFLEGFNPPVVTRFQQSSAGDNLLVMEAENFSTNTSQGGHDWIPINDSAASEGVAMLATPDTGALNATNYSTESPRLDYDVDFVTTGTHYVWVRGFSTNGTDNSVHIGLDGFDLTSSRRIDSFTSNVYDWTNQIIASGNLQVATINVTTTGAHTINAWMREDGFRLDKVFVTTDPNFVPSGFGPGESPLGAGGNTAPTITDPGNQINLLDEVVSLQILASDPDAGDTLTYSATGLPDGLSINTATGEITGIATTIGSFSSVVVVSDSAGFVDSESFDWSINAENQAPVIEAIADQIVEAGDNLTFTVTAIDDGPSPLILQALNQPFGSTFSDAGDGTGTFSWSPQTTDIDPDPFVITFRAIDDAGNGLETTLDVDILVVPPADLGERFLQSVAPGNLLVVEAENFTGNTPQGVHSWIDVDVGGASLGQVMEATPDNGTNNGVDYAVSSPRLDFEVSFVATGTHYVWVRGFPGNTASDSVHVGLDGIDLLTSRRFDDFVTGVFDWSGDIQVAPGSLERATIEVTSTGDHVLNIWMREDGFQVDKLLVTTDPSFVPTDFGPDESQRGSGSGNIAPTITSPGNQTSTQGELVTLQIVATDVNGDPLLYSATGLPGGLGIDAGTGLIDGTPGADGTFNVSVEVDDSNGGVANVAFTWTVNPSGGGNTAPTLTTPEDQTNIVGDAVNLQIVASDADVGDTLTYSATGLPDGVSIDPAAGLITGTVSVAGSFNPSVTVDDNNGGTANAQFVWTVSPAGGGNNLPSITNPGAQDNTVADVVSLQISATDPDAGDILTYSADGLPPGLSIDPASGLISGTTDTAGAFSTTVTVDDGNLGVANALFSWTVTAAGGGNTDPVLTDPGAQTNFVNDSVSLQINATDGDGDTLTYSATGLPALLTIDPASGLISGTATVAGTFSTTVTVDDGNGGVDSAVFSWQVDSAGGSDRFLQSSAAGNLLVVEAENFTENIQQGVHDWVFAAEPLASSTGAMEASPNIGTNNGTTYAVDSPRLDFDVSFVTSGIHYVWVRGFSPNTGGDSVHVGLDGIDLLSSRRLDDFVTNTFDWSGDIQVAPGTLQRATIDVPSTGDHVLNVWMREDGFQADKVFLTTDPNFVPTGLGPDESPISNGGGNTAPEVVNPGAQSNFVGDSVSLQIDAFDLDGDTLEYTATDLPDGLSIDLNSGLITGSPTLAGTFNTVVTVDDGNTGTANASFSWTVTTAGGGNNPPTITNPGAQTNTLGDSISFQILANDPDGDTLDYSAAGLPTGLSIDALSGLITGTTAVAGSFNTILTVDDGNGGNASTSFDWVIEAADDSDRFLQSSAGGNLLVVEAENFSGNTPQGAHSWVQANQGGASAGAVMNSTPNSGTNNGTTYAVDSPRLDFEVNFVATGTHYVWVRGFSPNTGADSVHVGLDGVDLLTSRRIDDFVTNTLDWSGDIQVAPGTLQRATIEVAADGDHTLNIWMREDGFQVDKLLLTTDPAFVPVALGPNESPQGSTGNSVPTITSPGNQTGTVGDAINLQIAASDSDGDTLIYGATDLPPTLTIDTNSGLITGTLTQDGSFNSSVTVDDGNGGSANASFVWTVSAAGGGNTAPALTNPGDQLDTIGDAVFLAIQASDADDDPLTYSASGLPNGLSIDQTTGFITGTPNLVGSFNTALAVDDGNGGTANTSINWTIEDVAVGNGSLTSTFAGEVNGSVNLTTVGSVDWTHWSGGPNAATNINRKASVPPLISDFTVIGNATPSGAGTDLTHIWSDGTPNVNGNTASGRRLFGINTGFQITVPADASIRTLNMYVGVRNATGLLTATLSDGSAAPLSVVVSEPSSRATHLVSIDYQSASANQTLTIEYVMDERFTSGATASHIAIESATLSGGNTSSSINLPFTDNFDDGDAVGWTVFNEAGNPGNWVPTNNQYRQQNLVRESSVMNLVESYHLGSFSFLNGGLGLTDYRFSVDVTPRGGSGDDVGVMFRYVNENNYYRLSFDSRFGYTRLEKRVDGQFTALASNAIGYEFNQEVTVEVYAVGSNLLVSIDGDLLFAVDDDAIGQGTVGLYAADEAWFDNIQLTEANAPLIGVTSPLAHSATSADNFTASAVAINVPSGATVDFVLDGGVLTLSDSTAPFEVDFTNLAQGDHTIEAQLVAAGGAMLASDLNVLVATEGESVLTLGDSITSGREDNFRGDNVSADGRNRSFQGAQPELNNLLTQTRGFPHTVVDEAVGGDDTIRLSTDRLTSMLDRNPDADTVLLFLGTNDADTSLPVPSGLGCSGTACDGTFKGNMQNIIDEVTAGGKTIFIARTPPSFGSTSSSTPFTDPANTIRNDIIQEYNEVVENELTNRNLGPDLFACFLGAENRFSLFSDNFHLNGLGNAVMAQLWHDLLTGASLPNDPCTTLPRFVLSDLSQSTIPPFHQQNLIEVGNPYYVDSNFTVTGIPAGLGLESGVWVMTADGNANNTSNAFLTFDVDRDVTVYVGYDDRATALPTWLSSYTATGSQVASSRVVHDFDLFSQNFSAGTITLGGNLAAGALGAQANYIVIVVEN